MMMSRLGLVALVFALVPSTAFALEVDCSNAYGSCTVNNDASDEVECNCGMVGGSGVTGGNDWSGLDEDELCQVCIDMLDLCEPFGGSTFGTTFADTDFVTTSAGVTGFADTGGGGDDRGTGDAPIGDSTTTGGGAMCSGAGASSSSSSSGEPPDTTTTDSTSSTGPGPGDTTTGGFDLTTTTGEPVDPTTGGPPDTSGDPSGVSQSGSATMTTAGSDTDSDAGGEDNAADDSGGCGCSTSPRGGPVYAVGLLGLLGLWRRRRTAPACSRTRP